MPPVICPAGPLGPLLTVALPVNPGAEQALAWPSKRPGDMLPFQLDATAYLAQAGLRLLDAGVAATPGLLIRSRALVALGADPALPTGVRLTIGGGLPGTLASIVLRLIFQGTDERTVPISLPIGAALPAGLAAVSPPAPEAAARVAGLVVTVGGSPILTRD